MTGKNIPEYSIEILRKDMQIISNWSGGTTTQLLIYPPSGDYAKRNFKWRVSSARVDTHESTFTSLPGISRIIMVLEGCLKLIHENHYSINLKPFEVDNFMGDWTTKSYGKVKDFNLMMTSGVTGELSSIKVKAFHGKEMLISDVDKGPKNVTRFYYCALGNVKIAVNSEENSLNPGDFMYITGKVQDVNMKIYNVGSEEASLVAGRVAF